MANPKVPSSKEVIDYVERFPGITHSELATKLRCTVNTLNYITDRLIDSMTLTRAHRKAGYYKVSKVKNRHLIDRAFCIARKSA